jgi:hypothetical protein
MGNQSSADSHTLSWVNFPEARRVVGLRAAWVLPDGTRVAVQPITMQEWSVRVNEVEVPSEAARVSAVLNYDLRFRLPSGQAAIARLRMRSGLSVWELCTGGRSLLYVGRRPFKCPSCRATVESCETSCAACGVEQPTNDARIAVMLRDNIVRSIAATNLFFVIAGVWRIITYREGADGTLASLRRAQIEARFPGQFDTSTSEGFQAGALALLQSELTCIAMLMCFVFAAAALAYRAPVAAASMKLALIAGLFLLVVSTVTHVPVMFYLVYAALAWSATVTLRAALDVRAARRKLDQQTAA